MKVGNEVHFDITSQSDIFSILLFRLSKVLTDSDMCRTIEQHDFKVNNQGNRLNVLSSKHSKSFHKLLRERNFLDHLSSSTRKVGLTLNDDDSGHSFSSDETFIISMRQDQ